MAKRGEVEKSKMPKPEIYPEMNPAPDKKVKNLKRRIPETETPSIETNPINIETLNGSPAEPSKKFLKLSSILEKSAKSSLHHKLHVPKIGKINKSNFHKFEVDHRSVASARAPVSELNKSENISDSQNIINNSITTNPKPFFYSEINSLVLV
jgi:hypothetical protein